MIVENITLAETDDPNPLKIKYLSFAGFQSSKIEYFYNCEQPTKENGYYDLIEEWPSLAASIKFNFYVLFFLLIFLILAH